jgi:hypothetical protein
MVDNEYVSGVFSRKQLVEDIRLAMGELEEELQYLEYILKALDLEDRPAIPAEVQPMSVEDERWAAIGQRAQEIFMEKMLQIENGIFVPGEPDYVEAVETMEDCTFVPEPPEGTVIQEWLPHKKRKRSMASSQPSSS